MTNSSVLKLCFLCGVDCSNSPRVKDTKGRYVCKPCADKAIAEKGAGRSPDAVTPLAVNGGAEPAAPATTSSASPDADAFELAAEPKASEKLPRRSADREASARFKSVTECTNCGYSTAGLPQPKCPECGHIIKPKSRLEHLAETSKETTRAEYLRPIFYFVGGLIGLALIHLIRGDPFALLVDSLSVIIQVPIGVGVFWLCCLMIFGFDAPMHLTALRLAGIYSVVGAVGTLVDLFTIGIVTFVVTGIVWIGMLMSELDLEIQDAVIYSLMSNFIMFVVGLALGAMM